MHFDICKNFQIKFSSGTNSYKKTAAATGAAATSNTVYNMNDTSKFSTSSNILSTILQQVIAIALIIQINRHFESISLAVKSQI